MPTIEAKTAEPVQITPQNQTPAIPNGFLQRPFGVRM